MRHTGSGLAQPDAAILRLAQRGDQRAFAVIVHAYERLVFTYIYRLVDDRRLAEDLTQDVFLKVFRGLPGFTGESAFTTWLFQIAKNAVIDELRAIERRPAPLNIDDVTVPMLVEPRFEQAEPIEALWAAVGAPERRSPHSAPAPRHRRPLVRRDRGLARDHPRHRQVADPQGTRERPGDARARGLRTHESRGRRRPGLALAERQRSYADPVSDWNTSYTRNIWRPEEPRLFVRRTDGIGWSINFAHLFRRTRRAA